jgi:multidrug efflux pump subunit AcrA (membrane-fusion protein)
MKIRLLMVQMAAAILIVTATLAGCGAFSLSTPTPLPTVVLGSSTALTPQAPSQARGGGVTASGVVVPARQAQLASMAGGNITTVAVAVGDRVSAGQALVQLTGSDKLAAAVEAANLELLSAQQALQALNDNLDQARAAAQLRIANAQKALDAAQKQRNWKNYRNGSQTAIQSAEADFILANDALSKAKDNYAKVADHGPEDLGRASALQALSAAQKRYDQTKGNLDFLLAQPDPLDVNQVEAELQAAKAETNAAQKAVDKLKNGPDPDAVALAQERIKNAQAQLKANQAALADLELKAPFDGVIAKVNFVQGEWVMPGQVILVLADLDHLRVETTDLSERDVPQVTLGQTVTVTVKALNQDAAGKVSQIAGLADTLGGDVVYKTTIDLDTIPAGLRAGMSVEVQFK